MSRFASIFLHFLQVFSSEKVLFRSRKPAFVQIRIHQDDVIPDLPDRLPRDHEVLMSSQQSEAPAWTRDDDRGDAAVFDIDLHIADKAQTGAVTNTDNLLAFEAGKAIFHILTHLSF